MSKINFLIVIFIVLVFCSCKNKETNKLTIATSANMQFTIHELVNEFQKIDNINCEIILGSSGKLTAQIKEGAPFDIFLSADMKYPNMLFKNKLTLSAPIVYAYGKLVIWTMNNQLEPSFRSMQLKSIKHIALANPKTAPYGFAAKEALQKLGIYKKIEPKLVFGESVTQTNQFIISYAAQIGITSKSIISMTNLKNMGYWREIDQLLYQPIEQGAVILKSNTSKAKNSKLFIDFLTSNQGKEILEKHGFSTPN